jgi:hypothetical protein
MSETSLVLMLGPLDWESIPLQTCERQAGKNLSFIVMLRHADV